VVENGIGNSIKELQLGSYNSIYLNIFGNLNNIFALQSGSNLSYSLTHYGNGGNINIIQYNKFK
jgi:hypothetical protein